MKRLLLKLKDRIKAPAVPRVIVFRPCYDVATIYASRWMTKQIEKLQHVEFEVWDFFREEAVKRSWDTHICARGVVLATAGAHGREDRWAGNDRKPVQIACTQSKCEVQGKWFIRLSCLTGRVLGKDNVEKGAMVDISYEEIFVFVIQHPRPDDPLDDKIAKDFLDTHNHLIYFGCDGYTAGEMRMRTKDLFYRKAEEWRARDPEIARYLFWDGYHLILHGDPDVRLPVPTLPKATFKVRVLDIETGGPIVGALVILKGDEEHRRTTDENGECLFTVDAGKYMMEVWIHKKKVHEQEVGLKPEHQEKEVMVRIPRPPKPPKVRPLWRLILLMLFLMILFYWIISTFL